MTEQDPSEYSHGQDDRHGSVEHNLRSRSTWVRLLFMLVIVVFYGVSRLVVSVVVVVQFFHVLFAGQANDPLKHFGESLATYTYQMLRYLMFNTEERPFPFDLEWPVDRPDD